MNETQNTVYVARLHKVIFVWPTVLLITGMILGILYPSSLRAVSLLFVVFSLIWLGMMWVTWRFSSLTVLKNQVVLRSGILVRQTVDIPYTKIETMDIRQSVIGSILRYGSLVITGTGGTRHTITPLSAPLTCRRHIEQQMHQMS